MNKLLTTGVLLSFSLFGGVYLSPEYAIPSADGKTAFITASSAPKIFQVDPEKASLVKEIDTAFAISGLTVARDGTLYAAGGGENGQIQKIAADGSSLDERGFFGRIFSSRTDVAPVGHTPMSPVVSADGTKLFVCNRFNNSVVVLELPSLKTVGEVAVIREPHAAVCGAGGALLFVANHLPYDEATNDWVSAQVSVIDTASLKTVKNIRLPNGSTGVRGICASADGAFIYVTHTFGRYQLPTTQLERGWMNTAGLSILDGKTGDYVNTVLLDDVDLGAANPWSVGCTPDGKTLLIAHAGTREVSVIDREKLHERLARVAKNEKVTEVSKSASDVPNDLSFLVSIRRRVRLPHDGTRGLAIVGTKAVVPFYFGEGAAFLSFNDPGSTPVVLQFAPLPDLTKDRARRGEMLFNDASMCFQMWQSCASCHPDTRTDALNWDLLNDGIGNPKQSKSLLLCDKTPPTMAKAVRPDMQTCNRKGMTHIQFVMRPEEDALCVDAFIMNMTVTPSPFANDPLAAKGKVVFEKAGCGECHPASNGLYTNLKKYNLELGNGNEEGSEFDTPTLVEVWRTGPYLYDGRAKTIDELFTKANNPKDLHGKTSDLAPEEIKALSIYVRSL